MVVDDAIHREFGWFVEQMVVGVNGEWSPGNIVKRNDFIIINMLKKVIGKFESISM